MFSQSKYELDWIVDPNYTNTGDELTLYTLA